VSDFIHAYSSFSSFLGHTGVLFFLENASGLHLCLAVPSAGPLLSQYLLCFLLHFLGSQFKCHKCHPKPSPGAILIPPPTLPSPSFPALALAAGVCDERRQVSQTTVLWWLSPQGMRCLLWLPSAEQRLTNQLLSECVSSGYAWKT
jgi:hypothetical protein